MQVLFRTGKMGFVYSNSSRVYLNLTVFPAETAASRANTHTESQNGSFVCYLSQTLTWKQYIHSGVYAYTHPRTHTCTHMHKHISGTGSLKTENPSPITPPVFTVLYKAMLAIWVNCSFRCWFKSSDPDLAELAPKIRLKESDYKVKV